MNVSKCPLPAVEYLLVGERVCEDLQMKTFLSSSLGSQMYRTGRTALLTLRVAQT